jgi:hypothetical protein
MVVLEVQVHQTLLLVVVLHTQQEVVVDQHQVHRMHQVELTQVMVEQVVVDHIHLVV